MPEKAARAENKGPLVYRQPVWVRLTHWTWAVALFFMLMSGLNIFEARPQLYIGQQSGFGFDNTVLSIGAYNTPDGPRGRTTVFGHTFDTTGLLGMSGPSARPQFTAFPGWATIPSFRDLATGRVVHFFFGWIFALAFLAWLVSGLLNRHIWRDVIPKSSDIRDLPRDIVRHIRLKFVHGRSYNPLQKLAYSGVFFVLFPLIILTGLTMSPGMDTAWPWLLDVFGGRQTARTIHFAVMSLIVLFFVVHIIMVVAAGPINELRSMITGWYRVSPGTPADPEKGDRP
jgi:thiosulfate reductase cytochrome b subunit